LLKSAANSFFEVLGNSKTLIKTRISCKAQVAARVADITQYRMDILVKETF
jgi:hypothetical protein